MAEKAAATKPNATVLSRIKRMMQQDEDVGKVAKSSPVLIARALDMFLQGLVEGAAGIAEGRGAKTLTPSHIKAYAETEQLLDFVKDLVASVPDLPPPQEEAPVKSPRAKRPRADSSATEGAAGGATGRGRGRGRNAGGRGGGGKTKRAAKGNKDIEMTDALAAQDPGADPVQPQDVAAAVEQGQGEQGEQLAGADESAAAAEAGLADNDVGHSGSGLQQQQQTGEEQALAAAEVQGTTEAGALVPPYLLAAAAVQGADAEEEDYDA